MKTDLKCMLSTRWANVLQPVWTVHPKVYKICVVAPLRKGSQRYVTNLSH